MTRKFTGFFILVCAFAGMVPLSCKPGGVGDPCTPEDEYDVAFAGFNAKEVNVESKSFQCETRVCLVNHFQGRVSCPYGQSGATDPAKSCYVPGHDATSADAKQNRIQATVDPQFKSRRADATVYCSCRCNGPDSNARYCKCPSGYACTELIKDLGIPGRAQLAGSYCIKEGTAFAPPGPDKSDECNLDFKNCD